MTDDLRSRRHFDGPRRLEGWLREAGIGGCRRPAPAAEAGDAAAPPSCGRCAAGIAEVEAQAIREAPPPPAATSSPRRACSGSRARRCTKSSPRGVGVAADRPRRLTDVLSAADCDGSQRVGTEAARRIVRKSDSIACIARASCVACRLRSPVHIPGDTSMQRRSTWLAARRARRRCAGRHAARRRAGAGQGDPHRPRLQQDRPARGLRQADADRPDDGPRLRDRRHDDGRRPEDRRDREGRPGQARRGQEAARHRLRRRQGRHRGRPDVLRRRAGDAAGRRGVQEGSCWSSRRSPTRSPATSGTSTSSAPAATARRTRSPTPSRSTSRACRSPRWRRTTRSAATA